MSLPFRELIIGDIREYLKSIGKVSLSSISANILGDIAQRRFDHELKQMKPTRKKSKPMSDDEWKASLRADPVYSSINFDVEWNDAQLWIKANEPRKFTRRFFENWLRKAIRDAAIKPKVSKTTVDSERREGLVNNEPTDWEEFVREYTEAGGYQPFSALAGMDWRDLCDGGSGSYAARILTAMKKANRLP